MFGALQCVGGKIEFVQVWYEEMVVFMVFVYVKFMGELGVCMVMFGLGVMYFIMGLYDVWFDYMFVLVIIGQQVCMVVGGYYQQEVDLVVMFCDVVGVFVY